MKCYLFTRILGINLMYKFSQMLLYMYSLLYIFFCDFYYPPLPPIAAGPVSGGRGNTRQN